MLYDAIYDYFSPTRGKIFTTPYFYPTIDKEVTGMIARDIYMKKLKAYKDNKLIKVITGLRRCGKSTLLQLFKQDLLESGVKPNCIVDINFEQEVYKSSEQGTVIINFDRPITTSHVRFQAVPSTEGGILPLHNIRVNSFQIYHVEQGLNRMVFIIGGIGAAIVIAGGAWLVGGSKKKNK